jgi:predicted ribosomally synthesized peptide with SipW-like signal peptide
MAKSKKIAIVVAAIALIAVIGVVGSTLAFFTDTDTKTNTFTMGNVDGTLEEKDKDGPIDGTGINFPDITPGDDLHKEPYMVLGGNSSDALARMNVKIDIQNVDDTTKGKVLADILSQIDTQKGDNWVRVDEDDGTYTYYYQLTLKKGQSTDPLFTHIAFANTYGNEIANMTITMPIRGDFVQADNFNPDKTGNQITGWGNVKIEQFNAPATQQTQQ